jgi:hypothetical protein
MKTFFNTIAGILVFTGLIVMAGSANDCDGKCMEYANSLSEMLMVAGIGLSMMLVGGGIILKNNS